MGTETQVRALINACPTLTVDDLERLAAEWRRRRRMPAGDRAMDDAQETARAAAQEAGLMDQLAGLLTEARAATPDIGEPERVGRSWDAIEMAVYGLLMRENIPSDAFSVLYGPLRDFWSARRPQQVSPLSS